MDGINKVKPVKTPFLKTVKRHWILLLMLLPAVLYVVIFSYIPRTGVVPVSYTHLQRKSGDVWGI